MSFLEGIERIDELDGYETSSTEDYVLLTLILVTLDYSNLNGAIFTKEEVMKTKDTIIDTPLYVIPDIFEAPTEHSKTFPKLEKQSVIVGHHTASRIIQNDGKEHLEVTAKLYKSRYPELVASLHEMHLSGQLFCSMECSYNSEEQTINGRILKGIKFIGNALVEEPAGQYSKSLSWEVARKSNTELNLPEVASNYEINYLEGIENLN
ncbi:hypothetical protein [Peribacillus butanolivorans]|uniref:hypothetical protein n=1 Tax=Peribacillus butanolivorans TaxID=421767 RepID=UPI0036708C6F